jgi:taurine dioxygenase
VPRRIDTCSLAPFGMEVRIDLSAPLSLVDQLELRRLYATHSLLLVREQRLTMEDQIRVMGYLGPVVRHSDGVGVMRPDNGIHTVAFAFHSDHAYSPVPHLGLSLHAVEVVDGGTSTLFANGARAYQALDPVLRTRIDGREALHVFPPDLSGRNRADDIDPFLPRSTHPVVLHNPVTGTPFLYVSENQTDSIIGLPPDESETILQSLFEALYDPSNVLDHRWNVGDIVIWDNLTLSHGRRNIANDGPRVMQRVVLGTKGIAELYPDLASHLAGDHPGAVMVKERKW